MLAEDTTAPYDIFVFYDSRNPLLSDGHLTVNTPNQNWYWMSLQSIILEFPNGYTPDTYAGFLGVHGLEDSLISSSTYIGPFQTRGKLLFPLQNPGDTNPTCKIYNRLRINRSDTIKVSYYDNTMTEVAMTTITLTMHISDDPNIIRTTLM